jgi:hypothetical protein
MELIEQFEQKLTEKVSAIVGSDVEVKEFDRYLSSGGEIIYTYENAERGCEIRTTYKGARQYKNGKIALKLEVEF